eukprot:4579154-Pyramimonas_sp.AAC.1
MKGRAAQFATAPLDDIVGGAVADSLRRVGVTRLYTHQEAAVASVKLGRDVVVATSTASGKSLCYNCPVLEILRSDPEATALYMFPTKVSKPFSLLLIID